MGLTGKHLISDGWAPGKALGLALDASRGMSKNAALMNVNAVKADPHAYLTTEVYGELAQQVLRDRADAKQQEETKLLDAGEKAFAVYGGELIAENTIEQMIEAMRIPVAAYGALMPDAHLGYGLPVGGVWALRNAVSPWAVGVDIACRMRLTVFEQSPYVAGQRTGDIKNAILEETRFGMGCAFEGKKKRSHEVLDDEAWDMTPFLKRLKNTAYGQLGTSGTGNHFVEFGEVWLNGQKHLGLLSHSGSRAIGAKIADRYAKIAEDKTGHRLGWLDLDSDAGAEYWIAMKLAGKFAAASHQLIHELLTEALSLTVQTKVENHHNFAWEEEHFGEKLIVHRKGATPASQDEWGVIPGTMADPGFVVIGKGESHSLRSASHGAGRKLSRSAAKKSLSQEEFKNRLTNLGITLMGSDLDEAPGAYKDIHTVLELQENLVDNVGSFFPKIVRMA